MRYHRLSISLLLASATPAFASIMPLDQAAKTFGARPAAIAADLSPSGNKVVFLSSDGGAKTTVKVLDLLTDKTNRVITLDGKPENLSWCEFATETKIVCQYGGYVHYGNVIAHVGRLVSIDLDKKQVRQLGVRETTRDTTIRQDDGTVLDWLPDENDGSVLMARNHVAQTGTTGTILDRDSYGGLGVERVDLSTLRSNQIEPPRENASLYMTDGRGAVRLMGMEVVSGTQLTGRTKYSYRTVGSKVWRDLGESDDRTRTGMQPLAIDRDSGSLFYMQKLNGRMALYSIKLDGSGTTKLIAKNDKVDLDGIVRLTRGSPVVGYAYNDDQPRVEYFDPQLKALAASLGRALTDTPLISFAGATSDGAKMLVHGSSDRNPGIYYLLDRTTKQAHAILQARPELENVAAAPVRSVTFKAADGTQVPAYLTMTQDGGATNRPAIVLPHGGPSSRDEWGFDWLTQFLAARGYVVIQPQCAARPAMATTSWARTRFAIGEQR